MRSDFNRTKSILLLILVAVLIAGCSALDQPVFAPAAKDELDRIRESQRLTIDATIGTDLEPKCTDGNRAYADVREFVDRHTIVAQDRGDIEGEKSGQFEEKFLLQFASIMTAFEKSRQDRILIYVNGGLNPLDAVRDQAANQIPCMIRDGYFPVFLIWQTGAFETYFEQILQIRNGELKDRWQVSSPLHLAGDIGEGIVRSPITLWNSVARYWNSTADVDPVYKVESDMEKARDQKKNPLYRNITILEPTEKSGNLLGREMLHALGTPVRLGTAPILDAMGKTAWENMIRRSRMTVRTVWEVQPELRAREVKKFEEQIRCFPRGTGVFAKFFQALQQYLKGPETSAKDTLLPYDDCGIYRGRHKGAKSTPLTLVGHSMGTMVLNELIPSYSTLPYENIVYLAAASSIRDFQRSVPWVIRRNMTWTKDKRPDKCGVKFYSLMLNPIAEARERSVHGLLLSGSLLEWIDDIYQNPKTMLDRTFGMWRNLRPALHVLEGAQRKCMSFKVFGFKSVDKKQRPKGIKFCDRTSYETSHPQKHGEFNDRDKCFWQKRFW